MARGKNAKANKTNGKAVVPVDYLPQDDEAFMNPVQREYFRLKLIRWRRDILVDSTQTLLHLQEQTSQEPDIADRASVEAERAIELRTRDRERKLLSKIDGALRRIDNGTYGYCEESGDPISLNRLQARPIATLSLDAQERHERMERIYRDD